MSYVGYLYDETVYLLRRISFRLALLKQNIKNLVNGLIMSDVRNLVGREVNGWMLTKVLGRGLDGIVYLGEKAAAKVAVKFYFPEGLQDRGFEQEMSRLELQLTLRGEKHHPNLVQIYDGGHFKELNTLYVVMEYVPGNSLDKILDVVPRAAIPGLLKQLADVAKFLEDKGLVHRDIKPANVVVSEDFSCLTLLDLGVVFQHMRQDSDRLSGDHFVASIRYSPPEFVLRQEEENIDAWRAITFYQIGATLHDMIMRRQIFSGHDAPRAKLYASVEYRTPEIKADDCEAWLVTLAKCCLIKNWRERLKWTTWASFDGASQLEDSSFFDLKKSIKLTQLLNQEEALLKDWEMKTGAHAEKMQSEQASSAKELWILQSKIFMEIRQFLMSEDIFPKFKGTDIVVSDSEYSFKFEFEEDLSLSFAKIVIVTISIISSVENKGATDLRIFATVSDNNIFEASWSEMFSASKAAGLCNHALFQIAEKVISEGC